MAFLSYERWYTRGFGHVWYRYFNFVLILILCFSFKVKMFYLRGGHKHATLNYVNSCGVVLFEHILYISYMFFSISYLYFIIFEYMQLENIFKIKGTPCGVPICVQKTIFILVSTCFIYIIIIIILFIWVPLMTPQLSWHDCNRVAK